MSEHAGLNDAVGHARVRVRYAETDQMGVVYYANYLVWFEVGRVELLRALGFSYSVLETEHECILPVVEATCRYRSYASYDDLILIETRPALLRGSVIKFAYRVLRKAQEGVAVSYTHLTLPT